MESKPDFRTPPRALSIGMYLFLASLSMLFLSSMLGYVLIRLHHPEFTVKLPDSLWGSTAILLIGSFMIHRAVVNVRRERQKPFRRDVYITLFLAIAFLCVQTPSMAYILRQHSALGGAPNNLYGLVFFLIMIHALHVVGGVIAMIIVAVRAGMGKYDHEANMGVRHAALYWHFLDIVWIIMFSMLLIAG
jgi:heme/copper-type cytochrome/quinol oxidase subunit 3